MAKEEQTMANTSREIVAGDVVALKSGSQKMTVTATTKDTVTVLWSDYDTKQIHVHDLPRVVLVRAA